MRHSAGDRVRIVTPSNQRLHGTLAVVESIEEWGYCLHAPAAATGHYRAWHDEVEPDLPPPVVRDSPTGQACDVCGSFDLRRTGPCMTCQSCGTSGGCG